MIIKIKLDFQRYIILFLMSFFIVFSAVCSAQEKEQTVFIGFDAEIGHLTSTSDDAIKMGISIAIEEINEAGGVLGGRKLAFLIKDNHSVSARGIANIKQFGPIIRMDRMISMGFPPV